MVQGGPRQCCIKISHKVSVKIREIEDLLKFQTACKNHLLKRLYYSLRGISGTHDLNGESSMVQGGPRRCCIKISNKVPVKIWEMEDLQKFKTACKENLMKGLIS